MALYARSNPAFDLQKGNLNKAVAKMLVDRLQYNPLTFHVTSRRIAGTKQFIPAFV